MLDVEVRSCGQAMRWEELQPEVQPEGTTQRPRHGHSAIYNPQTRSMLVFGGPRLSCSDHGVPWSSFNRKLLNWRYSAVRTLSSGNVFCKVAPGSEAMTARALGLAHRYP